MDIDALINNGSDPFLAIEDKDYKDRANFVDITIRDFKYNGNNNYNYYQYTPKSGSHQRKNKMSPPMNKLMLSPFTSPQSKPNSPQKEQTEVLQTLNTTPEMNNLRIPPFLQHAYLNGIPEPKITKLRDWQIQLFQRPEWLFPVETNKPKPSIINDTGPDSLFEDSSIISESPIEIKSNMSPTSSRFFEPKPNYNSSNIGCSSIVLVPTSGGKTVAAEVAIAQLLAQDPTAKAIYALPFVALANEKYTEFTKRFFNFKVRAFYQNIGGPEFRRGSIAVCTYEKAHSIINSALFGKYANKIKLVIIDEIHMIGEEHRGAVIEALVVKLLLMKHQPRIIGLTATINIDDARLLADWIRGFAFISDTRPSRVKQFVVKCNGDLHTINNDGVSKQKVTTLVKVENNTAVRPYSYNGNNNNNQGTSADMLYVIDPIRRLLSRSPDSTVLIFVNRRADTLILGDFISKHIYDSKIKNLPQLQQASEELLNKRRTLVQELARVSGFVDDSIKRCIINGIGIHHAGLLLEERKLIEAATRNKTISVIVATTTLSAGINIHSVARVFIMNVFRWSPQKGQIPIPNAQFIQMVGRAGRTANRAGEAFVFAHSTLEYEMRTISSLSKQKIENIVPHLKDEGELERFFLQCLSTKLVDPINGLDIFLQTTLNRPNQSAPTTTTTSDQLNPNQSKLFQSNSSQPNPIQSNQSQSNPIQSVSSQSNMIQSVSSQSNMIQSVSSQSNLNQSVSSQSNLNQSVSGQIGGNQLYALKDGMSEKEKICERLVRKKLINASSLLPTALGRAIAGSSLSIEDGLILYETIQKIQLDLCLNDEIHLLYLCVSPQIASLVPPVAYNNVRWIYIFEHHKHVIKLITGMNDLQIENMQDYPNIYGGLGRVNKKIDTDLDRIYTSVILRELINETPISEITQKFKIERGTIQSLQMQSATFAGQTSKFCEIIGSGLLATTLNRFRQRLNFAARTELLGLMVVPSITKDIARKLADVGINSPLDLADLSVEGIAALLVAQTSDSDSEDGKSIAPTDKEIKLAEKILKDSKEYEESFTKLEILEETAVANITE
ncbi:putative ATP-dependent RNA helicase ddx60 [Tritrichomonas musculus]|uniref:ATP-dependent RNA helicase ddx60 n=1 Tax=Tritrichomonas musculus TaxID=1915356 RepID=A0ABR2L5R0_9EUKA